MPFSLGQAHVAEGETDVWDEPVEGHRACWRSRPASSSATCIPTSSSTPTSQLFAARHDEGRHIREAEVIEDVLRASGVDADAVFAEIASGGPLDTIRKEHEEAVERAPVSGACPTFIADDLTGESQSVFVRLMDRPNGDSRARDEDRRPGGRPGDGLARAQRVQAHVDPALTSGRPIAR